MRILVTGFEPFEGSEVNPTEEVLALLQSQPPLGTDLQTLLLPVASERVAAALIPALEAIRPAIVLMLGQATGRSAFSIERVALNWLDFRIPDNSGKVIRDQPIVPDGPAAYFSTLPTRELVEHLRATDIPAELSYHAGTYLCNQAFYLACHWAAQHAPDTRVGFVHVPALPSQISAQEKPAPSMALSLIEIGVRWLLVYLNNGEVMA